PGRTHSRPAGLTGRSMEMATPVLRILNPQAPGDRTQEELHIMTSTLDSSSWPGDDADLVAASKAVEEDMIKKRPKATA
ncbi:hypothetical protein CgunFtcFv8_027622, partial [Champsocephalus gunnari]